MKENNLPRKLVSRESSIGSSNLITHQELTGHSRKAVPLRNITSEILRKRQSLRVIENDMDVTPKPLNHDIFESIMDSELTALENIGLIQLSNNSLHGNNQPPLTHTVSHPVFKMSSISLSRSSSIVIGIQSGEDLPTESFFSTQIDDIPINDDEKPPSEFYFDLEEDIFHQPPPTVNITLTETDTMILFELPQLIADLHTPEGIMIKEENERYDYITIGPGSLRKLVDSETQTIQPLTKTRGTYLPQKIRKNQGTLVNNWIIYDTYEHPEMLIEVNGLQIEYQKDEKPQEYRLLNTNQGKSYEDQLSEIGQQDSFKNIVRVVERIIASNLYITPQKMFKGIIKQDPNNLDSGFTYNLNLLWEHSCDFVKDMPVVSLRWSYSNVDLLAVAYSHEEFAERMTGVVLIWCMKNPSEPGRKFVFPSSISDLDWSKTRTNLLGIGFYNGTVKVLDVSSEITNIIRVSNREDAPTAGPHWQVQWWPGDEQFGYHEQLYTSNQNGGVYHFRGGEDFLATEIMRIKRVEGKIPGINRIEPCKRQDVPICVNPGAVLLCKHPKSNFYFVASDEGCIHRCSTNYLHHHIDSFLAHDGLLYSMEFSPFCPKIFLTCGADWCTRIWADGLTEPLINLSTVMACVRCATWSPTDPAIIATIANNEISIWDLRRKVYEPVSVTKSQSDAILTKISFTANGNQLVAADIAGQVYLYHLEGMPPSSEAPIEVLMECIEKALIIKQDLLKKLKKLGVPFGT
ncbi:dynein axonemal intermediate chain 4-like isoform X1 [Prorops nasuta]|uniref:dynein axonemal intermediate chain 4-like isoform X1 n=1 Tax=Prorops nasuta TaxID=863751 RepID=UPI0034CECE65